MLLIVGTRPRKVKVDGGVVHAILHMRYSFTGPQRVLNPPIGERLRLLTGRMNDR
jgi:hypothetical protein